MVLVSGATSKILVLQRGALPALSSHIASRGAFIVQIVVRQEVVHALGHVSTANNDDHSEHREHSGNHHRPTWVALGWGCSFRELWSMAAAVFLHQIGRRIRRMV
jgi:hypothetical protein